LLKSEFVVLGAFLLVLGVALIYYAPVLESGALYRAETSLFNAQSGGNINTTSIMAAAYNQALNTLNQAETISLAGVAIAPIGAAALAYGLVAGREQPKSLAPEPTQSS
jgi:uncharacterized RDD family membrane protein YckC